MNVSVVIPTRGGHDLTPILDELPAEWEVVVYDNGAGEVRVWESMQGGYQKAKGLLPDLSVYARYEAIRYASHDLIFTCDDDVIVSDPQAIVDAWFDSHLVPALGSRRNGNDLHVEIVACNMPPEFRHEFYAEHALVGFGAAFHRDAPERAFKRMAETVPTLGLSNYGWWLPDVAGNDHFLNTCDVAFTTLTPRILVDVPKTNLPYAEDANRMYRQQNHVGERKRMLDLALRVRDAR